MGKRAADGGSRDSAWSFLENIDTELAAAVCALYSNPLQFDGALTPWMKQQIWRGICCLTGILVGLLPWQGR